MFQTSALILLSHDLAVR